VATIPSKVFIDRLVPEAGEYHRMALTATAMLASDGEAEITITDVYEYNTLHVIEEAGATSSVAAFNRACLNCTKQENFPDMLTWVIGLSAGLLAFLCIMAVFLLLVNFRPAFDRMRRRLPPVRRHDGYLAIGNAADREPEENGGGGCGGGCIDAYSSSIGQPGPGLQRRKDLIVNTASKYKSLPGMEITMARGRGVIESRIPLATTLNSADSRRRSFDTEAQKHRPRPPTKTLQNAMREMCSATLNSSSTWYTLHESHTSASSDAFHSFYLSPTDLDLNLKSGNSNGARVSPLNSSGLFSSEV